MNIDFLFNSGSTEVGRVLVTASNVVDDDRDVIPCDGSDVDPVEYPELAGLLNNSHTVSNFQLVDTFGAGICRSAPSDSSGATIVVYGGNISSHSSTTISSQNLIHYGDVFNLSGVTETTASGLSLGSLEYSRSYDVGVNADGTKAFFVYLDTTTPALKAARFAAGSWGVASANATVTGFSLLTGKWAVYSGMSSSGNTAVAGIASTQTSRISMIYSPNGGAAWANSTRNGLGNVILKGLDCADNVVYLLDGSSTKKIHRVTEIISGTWSDIGADLSNVLLGDRPEYNVSEDGLIQLIARDYEEYEDFYISEDGGLSWDTLITSANGVDTFGASFTATIVGVTLQRDGDLIYSVRKELRADSFRPADGGFLPINEYIRTSNHDANWLVTDYIPNATSTNVSEVDNINFVKAGAQIMNADETVVAMGRDRLSSLSSGSNSLYTAEIKQGTKQLPFYSGAKIVAES